MNIAVLSGKGGTGKTTVATNLASLLKANYIDCDVEEPNGFIFLKPSAIVQEEVYTLVPKINSDLCIACGVCARTCAFNALFRGKDEIVVFEKMCHGCKTCDLVCEQGAITFNQRLVGIVEAGMSDDIVCKRGVLNVGEPMAVPVLKSLLKNLPEGLNLLDCSPGTSCNVINTLDYVQGAILVTEPSLFGLHDLQMAITLVRDFNLPFGVIINKYNRQETFVKEHLSLDDVKILGYLPFDREAAALYSQGDLLTDYPLYREHFAGIIEQFKEVFL